MLPVEQFMFNLLCLSVGVHKRSHLCVHPYFTSHAHWLLLGCYVRWEVSDINCCFEGCCFLYLFKTVHCIFVSLPSSFFSKCFLRVQVMPPYRSNDTATPPDEFLFYFIRDVRYLYSHKPVISSSDFIYE